MYLTPYALSDLIIWLLSGLFSLHLWQLTYQTWPRAQQLRHLFWLAVALTAITCTYISSFLTETIYPNGEFYVLPINILFIVTFSGALIQFFYHFPVFHPQRKRESQFFLGITAVLFLAEAVFAGYRYIQLAQGHVVYRPVIADLGFLSLLLWIPVAVVRQFVLVDKRPLPFWHKLQQPIDQAARTLRVFFFISISPVFISSVNIFRNYNLIDAMSAKSIYLLFSMVALLIAITTYLSYLPERSSFMVRLTSISLTGVLVALGVASLFLGRYVFAHYQPFDWPQTPQTLQFIPNDQGGYNVSQISSRFLTEWGTAVFPDQPLTLPFPFPFYNQTWTAVYPSSHTRLSFGQPLSTHNAQLFYGSIPAIYALNLELRGDIFMTQTSEQTVITWAGEDTSAVQLMLYANGRFTLTLYHLPSHFQFDIYRRWSPAPLLAVLPGTKTTPQMVRFGTELPVRGQSTGLMENFHQDYRIALHQASVPFAGLILLAATLMLLGLPVAFRQNVIRPLNNLLNGVHQIEEGNLNITIPTQFNDEIGYLTDAFNKMAAELYGLVTNLEERVEKRTTELLQQKQMLAAQEERRRLARDLHDAMTQSLHSLALSAKTAQYLLQKERYQALPSTLAVLAESANQAYAEMRLLLYELQMTPDQEADLLNVLQRRLEQVEQRSGIGITWDMQGIDRLPKSCEVALFYIAMEALNNAIRHAAARQIALNICQRGQQVHLEVKDDGHGFAVPCDGVVTSEQTKWGMGLKNMADRAQEAGGALTISSAPHKGTTITAVLPLHP